MPNGSARPVRAPPSCGEEALLHRQVAEGRTLVRADGDDDGLPATGDAGRHPKVHLIQPDIRGTDAGVKNVRCRFQWCRSGHSRSRSPCPPSPEKVPAEALPAILVTTPAGVTLKALLPAAT